MFWTNKKKSNPLDARWTFTDDLTETEMTVRSEVLKKIDCWWKAFSNNQSKIIDSFNQRSNFNIAKFMNDNLQSIHKSLFWEFGPAVNTDGHRLVITCESYKYLRPLVNEILRQAPKIPHWEFYSHRLSESFEIANQTVKARTGGRIDDLKVQADINEFNQIDLSFIRETAGTNDELNHLFNDSFVAVESLLGEKNLDIWIGAIEADSKPKEKLKMVNIKDLQDNFTVKLQELKKKLPEDYYFKISNDVQWAVFKLEPQSKIDYPGQDDIFTAATMNTDLWKSEISSRTFYSERFSKFREIFCYLKIDGTKGLESEKFRDKAEIEDALDNELVKAKAGCVTGGGTGLKYSYINFALADPDKGINAIKNVLRKGNITKYSWILFFDSELANEWIGIWPDSPKPMMTDFENKK